jgi:hypothetical protein
MRRLTAKFVKFFLPREEEAVGCEKHPFSSKNPVRLFIWIWRVKNYRRFSIYKYHGKWSYEAIQAARRAAHRNLDAISEVTEYTRKGVLYSGSLYEGLVHPSRKCLFLDFCQGVLFNNYRQSRMVVYEVGPCQRVWLGKICVFVPVKNIPLKEDRPAWLTLRTKVRNAVNSNSRRWYVKHIPVA